MIIILQPDIDRKGDEVSTLLNYLETKPAITPRFHQIKGEDRTVSEIYLLGQTTELDEDEIEQFSGVERVVRVSKPYAVLGRHRGDIRSSGFTYNGVTFNQDNFHLFRRPVCNRYASSC